MRSAFWLSVAFLVIKPEADLRESAQAMADQAMASGSQFVAEQIDAIACDTIQCLGGKAIVAAALPPIPPSVMPMHEALEDDPIPYPRPRPDRAG